MCICGSKPLEGSCDFWNEEQEEITAFVQICGTYILEKYLLDNGKYRIIKWGHIFTIEPNKNFKLDLESICIEL